MSRLPAAQRREQLLDHAAQLFALHGYARATTAQLAKDAGVTEPILYRHFKSKRDLFIALIERSGKRTISHWEGHLAGAKDAAERLQRLIGDNPMVSEHGMYDYRVLLQAITEVEDPLIQQAVTHHVTDLHAFLSREIERAQAEHKVAQRFSADIIAWLLIHIGLGYGSLTALGVPGQGTDRDGMHVQDVLERVLLGRAAKERDSAA